MYESSRKVPKKPKRKKYIVEKEKKALRDHMEGSDLEDTDEVEQARARLGLKVKDCVTVK